MPYNDTNVPTNGSGDIDFPFGDQKPDDKRALTIKSISIDNDYMVCEVYLSSDWHYTNSRIANAAKAEYPHIIYHTCMNSQGFHFGDAINHTSLAHLLEHLTIDSLVRLDCKRDKEFQDYANAHPEDPNPQDTVRRGSTFTYAGVTEWVNEQKGHARVQIRFCDDVDTLNAIKHAAERINAWCAVEDPSFEG